MERSRLPRRAQAAVTDLIERYGLDDGYLPVPIYHIAQEEGWEVRFRDELPDAYGVAVVTDVARVMVVRGSMTSEAKRYTVAHEMGHLLCGHRAGVHLHAPDDTRQRIGNRHRARQESEADMVAAAILIPREVARQATSLAEITRRCKVPKSLAKIRASMLGLVHLVPALMLGVVMVKQATTGGGVA